MNSTIVRDFVIKQHSADAWLYLLIDPVAETASDDHLHIEKLRQRLGDSALTVIPRPDMQHDIQSSPVLITIAAPGIAPQDDLLGMSGHRAQRDDAGYHRYVCGWLSSTATAEVIRGHLQKLSLLPSPLGATYKPMHEPIRLELMAGIIGANKHGPWWPVQRWLLPSSDGEFLILKADAHAEWVAAPGFADMQDEIPLARVLLHLWRSALKNPPAYAPAQWEGRSDLPPFAVIQAVAQIKQARALDLSDDADILQLAIHQLLLHPSLHCHPTVNQLIGAAAKNLTSLTHSLGNFQDEDWQLVVNQLNEGVGR